jgi:glycosyltransferase involved in cell wall biosynthesis
VDNPMPSMPLVTVLMTVYNGAEYLNAAVQSIINQTFEDFEFLIINDCSTDDSTKIIESFNDKRIVIYDNEKNIGQTKSLNIGLKLAKCKYIARIDADDVALPKWLEILVRYIKEHPEYAAVSPSVIIIDGVDKRKKIRRVPAGFHEIIFQIFYNSPMNHVSVLMNKDLILEHGGYDETFKITQDYELWSSLVRNSYSITNIPDVLMSCRVHSNSTGFVEADRKALKEKSETIFRNINAFTNLKLAYEDTVGICKLFYHTHDMNQEEFELAETNFVDIYSNMKERFKLPSKFVNNEVKAIMSKPYCKLAISRIQNNKIKDARGITLKYCSKYGFRKMPFLIFMTTFAGLGICSKLPFVYGKWLEIVTIIFLWFKSFIPKFKVNVKRIM